MEGEKPPPAKAPKAKAKKMAAAPAASSAEAPQEEDSPLQQAMQSQKSCLDEATQAGKLSVQLKQVKHQEGLAEARRSVSVLLTVGALFARCLVCRRPSHSRFLSAS